MPELENIQNRDSISWLVESFRLTAFLSPSAQIVEKDWWKKLTGELPDRKTSEPRTGIQQEEGRFKNDLIEGQLILIIQPTRIDWQLVPLPDSFGLEFPAIGSSLDALDSFYALMSRWLEFAPPIQRLAFGVNLNSYVDSLEEGYERISSHLPFKVDKNSSDFLYQINRPRKSKSAEISDLVINRLSKWNVSLFAIASFAFNQPSVSYTNTNQFAIHLELDINTSSEFSGEFSTDQLPQIFQELVELGKEIANKGDIK